MTHRNVKVLRALQEDAHEGAAPKPTKAPANATSAPDAESLADDDFSLEVAAEPTPTRGMLPNAYSAPKRGRKAVRREKQKLLTVLAPRRSMAITSVTNFPLPSLNMACIAKPNRCVDDGEQASKRQLRGALPDGRLRGPPHQRQVHQGFRCCQRRSSQALISFVWFSFVDFGGIKVSPALPDIECSVLSLCCCDPVLSQQSKRVKSNSPLIPCSS